jgi:tetratricopeptide (TPR) repeat protein
MASTATKKEKKTGSHSGWFQRNTYALLIALFTFLLFANSLGNDYNMDDELVTINHRLTSQGIAALPEIFTSPYYQDAMGYSYEYRPMVLASFAVEHQFFGESAFVSHFFNLLLYLLLAVLLFKVLEQLLAAYSPLVALGITLLFVAHTSHTEVVCSIKNRDEILAMLFGVLALRSALLFVGGNKWQLGAVFLFYTAALMSKVTIMSFVFIIPLLLLFFTKAAFKNYLVLLLIFVVPTHFFITNLGNWLQHALISLSLMAVPLFFLFVECFNRVKSTIINWLTFLRENEVNSTDTRITLANQTWINTFSSEFNFSSPIYALPALFWAILFSTFLYFDDLFFAQAWLVTLLFSYVFITNKKFSFWNGLLICVVVVGGSFTFAGDSQLYKRLAVIISLLIYKSDKSAHARSLFFCMAVFFSCFELYKDLSTNTAIIWIGLFFLPKKWGVIPNFLFSAIPVAQLIWEQFFLHRLDPITLYDTLNTLFIASLYIKKSRQYVAYLLLIGLFFGINLAGKPVSIFSNTLLKSVITQPQKSLIESNNIVQDNLIPIGTDRPILYIEQAVQPTDPLSVKLGTSAVILLKYLQKVVVPYPLAFYYGYGAIEPTPLSDWRAVLSVVLHALLFLAAFFFWYRDRLLSAGLWIYLLSILFFANYFVPIAGMYADRFLLVPSIGFVLVLVSLLLSVFKLEPQKLTLHLPKPPRYAFIALLSFWSVLTFSRNFHWKDHLTLMRKDVQYVTNSAQAHNLLALNIMKSTTEGQKTQAELDALRQEALGHFKQSFAIYPKTFNVAYDIGRVYSAMNNPDSMMVYFQKAADLDPDHQLPELSYTLAVYHQETKKYDYAIIQLQKLLKLQNTNLEAYSRLSYIYFTLGQYDQALATNRTAAFNLPTRPEPFINIAYTFQGMKNLDSMTYYFSLAEQRFPGHPVVLQAKRNLNNQ